VLCWDSGYENERREASKPQLVQEHGDGRAREEHCKVVNSNWIRDVERIPGFFLFAQLSKKIDCLKGLGEPRHEASQNSESVSSWLRHTKVPGGDPHFGTASDLEELNRTLCMASTIQNGKPTIPFTHEACQAVT
jgi:hypothetical protein